MNAFSADMGQRNVLLVGDNRDNPNWGSRSTSIALLSLLGESGLFPFEHLFDADVQRRAPVSRWGLIDRMMASDGPRRHVAETLIGRGGRVALGIETLLGIRDGIEDDPSATVEAWRKRGSHPALKRLIDLVEGSDGVIINGEGSMIFTATARREQRFHLAVMLLAREADVPYAYINALAADPPHGQRNEEMRRYTVELLEGAGIVTARDPDSFAYLRSMSSDIRCQFIADAVFAWAGRVSEHEQRLMLEHSQYLKPHHEQPDLLGDWDFTAPYICVGGSSEAAKDPARARVHYTHLLRRLMLLELPVYATVSCLGDTFLEAAAGDLGLPVIPARTNIYSAATILANAALNVTGRYHPTILAALGGVPSVLLGADSHKTTSVQKVLGFPSIATFPVFPDEAAIEDIASRGSMLLTERPSWEESIARSVKARRADVQRLGPLLRQHLFPQCDALPAIGKATGGQAPADTMQPATLATLATRSVIEEANRAG